MSDQADTAPAGALQRRLGFVDLVAYGLAYIAPIAPLSTLGFVWAASNGLIALAYLVGGVCMLFTANSYAVMTREVRSAGSVYGFAREILGKFAGFMGGWLILLDYLLIPAVVYVLIAVALSQLVPGVDRAVWIVLLVVSTFAINWFGVKTTSRVNLFSVAAQTLVVVIVLIAALAALAQGQGAGHLTLRPFYSAEHFSASAIFTAASICIMSFLGFDAVSTLAEETQDPSGKTMGRAILTSLLVATGLFVATTWILGSLMQGLVVKDGAAGAYELTAQRIGPWVAALIAWTYALVVGFTNALPMQVGVARMLFAMSRDRQLPAFMARVHPKYGTPWVAMGLASAVSCVVALAMRDHLDELASIVNFGALLGFLLLHLCVLVRFGFQKRSTNVLLHWVAPVLGMIVVGAVLTGMSRLAITLGAVWTLVGFVLCIWLALRRKFSSSVVY